MEGLPQVHRLTQSNSLHTLIHPRGAVNHYIGITCEQSLLEQNSVADFGSGFEAVLLVKRDQFKCILYCHGIRIRKELHHTFPLRWFDVRKYDFLLILRRIRKAGGQKCVNIAALRRQGLAKVPVHLSFLVSVVVVFVASHDFLPNNNLDIGIHGSHTASFPFSFVAYCHFLIVLSMDFTINVRHHQE
jgi:hypothetical protein